MLLMGGDRKRMVSQIMGDPDKKAEGESPLHAVMSEFIDAVHAHDVEGAITCLKSAIVHCSSEGSETGE